MQVRIKMMGALKAKTPAANTLELAETATIDDALRQLGVDAAEIQIVMLNGSPEPNRQRELSAGDELTVLPPVGGG